MVNSMSKPKCPDCDSSTLSVERRPDGDARCAMCGWSGKYAACFGETYKVAIQNPEARIKELEAQLKEANEALSWYADEKNWMTTHKDELHEARMTIAQDAESFGVCHSPGLVSTLLLIGGKRAREYVRKWKGEK